MPFRLQARRQLPGRAEGLPATMIASTKGLMRISSKSPINSGCVPTGQAVQPRSRSRIHGQLVPPRGHEGPSHIQPIAMIAK